VRRARLAAGAVILLAVAAARAEESPRVSPADWYWGPANRWSWQHMRRVFPTANIGRGAAAAAPLKEDLRDLGKVTFTDPVTHRPMSVEEMLSATYTDGFIVLEHGVVVFERYMNGLTRTTPHLLMSITKSFVGTLTGILVERGQIDPDALVTRYLPELEGSVFQGAKVRDLLDMTVAARIGDDPYTPIDQAAGWLPGDASSPAGLRRFLLTLKDRDGAHGAKFIYLDPSPQVMAWIIERVTREDFSAVLQQRIWSRLGAESDAYIVLDHHQEAYTTPGLNVTLPDLARFAQMMAQGGRYNGRQIVPRRWVEQIRAGGDRAAWNAGIASGNYDDIKALPGHLHGSYRDYWWGTDSACGRFAGIGIGGQVMVVDPIANVVAVKLSSTPDIASGEATTITAYQAIDAIIRTLSKHGC